MTFAQPNPFIILACNDHSMDYEKEFDLICQARFASKNGIPPKDSMISRRQHVQNVASAIITDCNKAAEKLLELFMEDDKQNTTYDQLIAEFDTILKTHYKAFASKYI